MHTFSNHSPVSFLKMRQEQPWQNQQQNHLSETRLRAMVCDMDLSTMNEMELPQPEHMFHLLCASAKPPRGP